MIIKDQLLSFLSNIYVRLDRRPRLMVTSYHRIEDGSPIKAEDIRRQFEFLKRHYKIVLPSQLEETDTVQRIAMVTIDDCHADIYKYIFPIAKSMDVPFVVCVPTDFFFRNRWLWFDRLYWILEQVSSGKEIMVGGKKMITGDPASIEGIKNLLKSKKPAEREVLIDMIAMALGCNTTESPSEYYRAVSLKEMKEMLDSGLTEICAHTVTHTISTVQNDEELLHEMQNSKEELERYCGNEISSFCYPNGNLGDFDDRTTKIARSAGFKIVFTSIEGTNLRNKMDVYRVRRVHAHQRFGVFKKLASGLGDLIQDIKRMSLGPT